MLLWAAVVLLAVFGMYFSLANYPWFSAAVALLILLRIGYSEQKRRGTQKAKEAARRRDRMTPETSEGREFTDG